MYPTHFDNWFFKTAVDQCNDLVVITDKKANILYVNPAFEKHTGYNFKYIRGKNISIVKSGVHTDSFYKTLWNSLNKGISISRIFINKKKNGELYYENKTITPVKNKKGKVEYFLSTSKDTTEEVNLQRKVLNQKDFIETVLKKTDALIVGLNKSGKIVLFNTACERLTGYRAEDVFGKSVTSLFVSARERKRAGKTYKDFIEGTNSSVRLEFSWVTKNKKEMLIRWSNTLINDLKSEGLYILLTGIDITNEKENEKQLRDLNNKLDEKVKLRTKEIEKLNLDVLEKNKFISRINTDLPALIYLINLETKKVKLFNVKIGKNITFPAEAGSEINVNDFISFFNSPKNDKKVKLSNFFGEKSEKEYSLMILGRTYHVQNKSVVFDTSPSGKPVSILGFVTDITETKSIQNKLEEAQRLANIGTWEWNIGNNDLYWSDQIYRIFEIDPAKFKPSYPKFLKVIHQGDRKLVEDAVKKAIDNKEMYEITHRLEPRPGKIKYVIEKGYVEYDITGKPTRMIGTVRDITEPEYARKVLEESQRLARIATWEYSIASDEFLCSKEMYSIFEIESHRKVNRQILNQYVFKEDIQNITEAFNTAIEKKEMYEVEYRIKTGHKKTKHIIGRGYAEYDSSGTPVKYFGSLQDITSEKKLRNRLLGYYATLENSLSAIFTSDLEGNITYANKAAYKMWGYDDWESMLREKPRIYDYWMENEASKVENCANEVLKKGYYATEEPYKALKRNGEIALIKFNVVLIKDENNVPVAMTGSFFDITEKIKLDNLLIESVKKYRSLYENALAGIFRTNVFTQKPIEANEVCVQMFGYESKEDFLTNFVATERYANIEDRNILFRNNNLSMPVTNQKVKFKKKDGSYFWGVISAKMLAEEGVVEGVVLDVTENHIYEEKLKQSLIEKDILLKEVHHRVKNNLQIISSLLNLQLNKILDPEIKQPLIESKQRVKAIALIHEKLYLSNDISTINFSDYLVTLASPLKSLNEDLRIKLEYEMDDFFTNMDIAIPLALACYEIISNAFKHAFAIKRFGVLKISVKKTDSAYIIDISDDGDGFDTRKVDPSKTLGWNLISSLVKQARATLTINTILDQGTTFSILLPDE